MHDQQAHKSDKQPANKTSNLKEQKSEFLKVKHNIQRN